MPTDLLEAGQNDAQNIFAQAYAATENEPEIVEPTDDSDPSDEDQPQDPVTEDDSEDEDVDNDEETDDESEEPDEDAEDEDEDLEEGDDEETDDEPEEGSEEPEEDAYASEYLYRPEGEDRDLFLRAKDPVTGEFSEYLNREEAEVGLGRQLAYIGTLKKQVDTAREASAAKLAEMQEQLTIFTAGSSPEAAKETLIRSKMPENLRNVNVGELGEDQLKAYKTARLEAEIAAEREIQQAVDAQKDADKANQEAEDRATRHVASRAADVKFFGFKNMEDRVAVSDKLEEKPEGSEYSYQDIAISISKAYGNAAADMFLRTLIPSPSTESPAEPETKTEKKTSKQKPKPKKKATKETAEKVSKKVKRKKRVTKSETAPATPTTAKEMLQIGFEKQGGALTGRRRR